MAKIKMTTPVVELDGCEMTRIIWTFIGAREFNLKRMYRSRNGTIRNILNVAQHVAGDGDRVPPLADAIE
jgi:isocitrate dehydrogenase